MTKILLAAILTIVLPAFAEVKVDAPAPTFSEADSNGKTHSLEEYKGKWLVLEWFNKDCPYVVKHYGSKNMQGLQRDYTGKGVAWLTVISSAEGKQGHLSPAEALAEAKKSESAATATLLDVDGNMGRTYGAKTTPHMFVINPEGKVVYAGAIDSNNSSDPKTIAKAKNYVREALDAGLGGKTVAVKSTKPYGCSVKY